MVESLAVNTLFYYIFKTALYVSTTRQSARNIEELPVEGKSLLLLIAS